MGYEAVDNLPLSLLPSLVGRRRRARRSRSASMCARATSPRPRSLEALDRLAGDQVDLKVIFLDCADELLERRYTETRRRHPLAARAPRRRRHPARASARLAAARPRRSRHRQLGDHAVGSEARCCTAISRSTPSPASPSSSPRSPIATACRATPISCSTCASCAIRITSTTLRPRDGRDPDVGAYIEQDADFHRLFDRLCSWLEDVLPCYEREGRELSHHCHRLHRRPPSLGLLGRAARGLAQTQGPAGRARASRHRPRRRKPLRVSPGRRRQPVKDIA